MKKQGNKSNNMKSRGKKLLIPIVLIMLAVFIVLILPIKTEKPKEKYYYYSYKQDCKKNNSYYEELSYLAYKFINKSWIKEFKDISVYCSKSDENNLTKDEFEDFSFKLKCKCFEYNIKACPKEFELVGDSCYSKEKKLFTNVLKICSRYECENNYFAEFKII